ncbi:protein archease [Halorientalis sp. IM1011]|uniref:archease n=1 Tax=Halorientalis sp. IM1011 TaxID=1932360 RepID=UPI00097CCCB6|nr:archease [Halorientalis sp. IM1011]AQL41521.1 protein archease [Halorientalis sp. IM1011]
MGYELRNHTADVAVDATGETLGGVFAAVADGLAAAMCDEIPEGDDERFALDVRAENREALLFDYLDELIYERDVRGVLPVDHEASVSEVGNAGAGGDGEAEWVCEATARGVPLSAVDARDVKAVTYSEMVLEETADGWHAYVVFDV